MLPHYVNHKKSLYYFIYLFVNVITSENIDLPLAYKMLSRLEAHGNNKMNVLLLCNAIFQWYVSIIMSRSIWDVQKTTIVPMISDSDNWFEAVIFVAPVGVVCTVVVYINT